METVAPRISLKMTAIFKSLPTTPPEIQCIKQNNWFRLSRPDWPLSLSDSPEGDFKTPTTMLGHSFQAGLSIYRAGIKLHFTR